MNHKRTVLARPLLIAVLGSCLILGNGRSPAQEAEKPPTGADPGQLKKILEGKGQEIKQKLLELPGAQQEGTEEPGTEPAGEGAGEGVAEPTPPVPPPPTPPRPPRRPPLPGRAGSPGQADGFVSFNFDNVDLYDFVAVVSEITGISYVIAPGVSGKITVQTTGKVAKEDVIPIFHSILDVYGLAAVKSDDLYRIVPGGKARQERVDVFLGKDRKAVPDEDRLIIQVVPLAYISAAKMAEIARPYISPQGAVTLYGPTNSLIFTELASKVRVLLNLVEIFDVDIFTKAAVKMIPLRHSKAEDLAKEVDKIFKGLNISDPSKEGGIELVPLERLNSLLVISSTPELLKSAEAWIEQLDIEVQEAGVRTFVYHVEHGKAADLAQLLTQFYEKKDKERLPAFPGMEEQPPPLLTPPGQPEAPGRPPGLAPGGQSQAPRGEVTIVAYEPTNSLIIQATPSDYRAIEATIKELDLRPKQVLIEALIAEITLDDQMDFGIQWTFRHFTKKGDFILPRGGTPATETTSATPGATLGTIVDLGSRGSGITYSLLKRIDRDLLDLVLDLFASQSKVNILSSPHVVARDNEEARIQVAQEIPFRTGRTIGGGVDVGGSSVATDQFQFRDTGVLLTVTPHVNSKDLVTLEISQEVSQRGPDVDFGTSGSQTSFQKRNVKTTVVVQTGDTLIIGGLIDETVSHSNSGIPFLKDLPLFKYLFGSQTRTLNKVELMVTITPYVISTDQEGEQITEEFRRRVQSLRRRVGKEKKKEGIEEKKQEEKKKEEPNDQKGNQQENPDLPVPPSGGREPEK